MKKNFFNYALLVCVSMICFLMSGTAFAAKDYQSVGVVIVGGADFKTEDFYKAVRSEIKPKSGAIMRRITTAGTILSIK